MVNTKLVAIYCRLSEEDRNKIHAGDDSESIKNQKAMLSQYCLDHDWEIYQVYSDDDYTGSDRGRPAFNQLLKDAEAGKFHIVLCKTQSRFTRELEMVEKYIHYLFPLWGIRFISIVDNADTDVKGNKKSRQINGLINEWYLEDMSENIKAVLTNRRRNGFFIGAFAPYGYKKDPNLKGHLIIDEPAATIVRRIYDLYLEGHGRTAIARILNADGIDPPSMYKTKNGERYYNRHSFVGEPIWRYYSIQHILTDEVYRGNLVQNKAHSISYKTKIIKPTKKEDWIRVENTHEPIISEAVWLKAQDILASRRNHTPHSPKQSAPYAFHHRLVCSECGSYLKRHVTNTNTKHPHVFYVCGRAVYGKDCCNPRCRITEHNLRRILTEALHGFFEKYADPQRLMQDLVLEDKTLAKIDTLKEQIQSYREQLDESSRYVKNLYMDKLKGLIDDSMYTELSKQFTSDVERCYTCIQQCEQKIVTYQTQCSQAESRAEIISKYINFEELTYTIIDTFISTIIVHPSQPYSREVDIEINWKF